MRNVAVFLAALSLLATCGVTMASAETIFKVDILDDTHTDAQYIEDGFVGWAPRVGADTSNGNPNPIVTTINNVTVTFDSGYSHQDRYRTYSELDGVPYEALYRDTFWGRAADAQSQGLDITLGGLTPDQQYTVALYCYGLAGWGGRQSCDWYANGNFAFNAAWDGNTVATSDLPTAPDTFRHEVTVAADANGNIALTSVAASDNTASTTYWANCSAIELYAVPEPGTIALLACVLLVVPFVRRRG